MAKRTRTDTWAWLDLIDREGPFIAVPALKRVYPQGIPATAPEVRDALRDAKPAFDRHWDTWNASVQDDETALLSYRDARDAWVAIVLAEIAMWGSRLSIGENPVPGVELTASSPDGRHTVTASGAFVHKQAAHALVLVVDPVRSLREPGTDGWSATPIDRMELLLRATGVPVGIVTDGRWWGLVSAPAGTMVASGIVDAQTWVEEPEVRDAFLQLISPLRLAGGKETERLTAMFVDSVAAAEEITESLGTQVRRAVELLVAAFSDAALQEARRGRPDPLPAARDEVYQAAVTTVMRVVFLLFAEERDLMPQSSLYSDGYAISGRIDDLEQRNSVEGGESLDATSRTWHRLLATSQALFRGVGAEDLRLPSYGGSLFDPDRFDFLLREDEDGLVVTVSDRVMLEVLRAVQHAEVGGQRRRVSFRDVDVEQIGYIYEGLLGYSCTAVDTVTLGLIGKAGEEPEIPLDVLDDLAEASADDATLAAAIIAWVKEDQPAAKAPTTAALKKALANDDPPEAEQLLRAATSDPELRVRLRPYLGIIRRDLRERLVVIEPGGLAVVETPSRATSGAHYTPKALAQEVVRHALEPKVYLPGPHQTSNTDEWVPISSDDILELKVADIACGSGAFLVSAGEYLADKLVEARQREGVAHGTAHEQRVDALREVVAHCLYGADINPMAVEMCKISLWLLSLDPHLPFSFVDDKVLCGNSLLGLTGPDQLKALHIDPTQVELSKSSTTLFADWQGDHFISPFDITGVLHHASDLRRRLASPVDDNAPQRATRTKQRLWQEYKQTTEVLDTVADAILAAGLRLGGKPGKALNAAYDDLRAAIDTAYGKHGSGDTTAVSTIIEAGLTPTVETDYERWKPLHWVLAVPDVMEHGGFDAIIGNPPFLGGKKISPAMGSNLREWFAHQLAGRTGNGDLVAYFFLRAYGLLNDRGALGLIATNTIAQGDTREIGLDQITHGDFTITRSIQSRAWPAKSANLQFAAVWGTRGHVGKDVCLVADGEQVPRISTLLEAEGATPGQPTRLNENRDLAFQGCIVLGKGFVITPEQARAWIDEDPRNADILFPYLNGEDLNSRHDASPARWVIDMRERSEKEARAYASPFRHLDETVRPERIKKDADKYPRMVNEWWKYWNARPALRRAIANLDEVLVIARVSRAVMPMRIRTEQVFSDATVVFATDSYADQAVLSSSLHQMWAITYGSTLETRVRYTPSDVFETFARPRTSSALDAVGRTLDEERREIMLRRELGLTKLYNRVNDPLVADSSDPDIARLREIHVQLDETVMAAYGWDDLELGHGFHTYRQMERWTVSPQARVEILDRLLEENHRRAAEQ